MDYDIYVINLMDAQGLIMTYAFVGDTLISTEEFKEKREHYLSLIKQHLTVSEDIWQSHITNNLKTIVMIQDYIFIDDTIYDIKMKLFNALQKSDISTEDIYLYCETKQNLNAKHIYQILTNNNIDTLTKQTMNEYLLNYTCINSPIADKDVYTYEEFINDPNILSSCDFNSPFGYNHLQYFFTTDPFKVDVYDESKLSKQNINYYPKQLLLELGQIKSNTIYACLSDSVLTFHKDKGLHDMYSIKIYFPELYQQQILSLENIKTTAINRYDKTITNYTKVKPQLTSLNNIQDLYTIHQSELNYVRNGIRELMFIYHPHISFDIPIHLIFKIIHSTNTMPMIKYNPGSKQENLYRLFTGNQISSNGRKIPIIHRPKMLHLIREINTNNTVICYCIHNEYILTFEFNSIGEIIIRYNCEFNHQKQPILKTLLDIENDIRKELTPILETINTIISQGGIQYTLFDSIINNPYTEIINIFYEYQIVIENDIDLTPFINCLSTYLMIESPTLTKGIKSTFKRVPNYNTHSEKEKLILTLISQKKNIREIKHLLSKNFKLSTSQTEEEINKCIQNIQTEISMFGKQKVKLKDNPGIEIVIERQNLSFQTTIQIKNITHINYLFILNKYIATILFLTQFPHISNDLICNEKLNTQPPLPQIVEQSHVVGTTTKVNINDLLLDDDDDIDEGDDTALNLLDNNDSEDEDDEYLLFNYGSNHKLQLEERIGRELTTYNKASVKGYTKIFGGYSDRWNGAVASIIENKNDTTIGYYTILSHDELFTLDTYESSYERIKITILNESDEEKDAYTYVKIDTEWNEHPSIEYLQACFKNIELFWPDTTITVKNDQNIIMGTYNSTDNSYVQNESSEKISDALGEEQVHIEDSPDAVGEEEVHIEDSPDAVGEEQVHIEDSPDAVGEEQVHIEDSPDAVGEEQVHIEDSSEDSSEEEEEIDIKQRGGLKKKVDWTGEKLNNPTPFANYAQELEPNLYLTKKGEGFNKYSSACPSNLKRQPVILTKQEYEEIIKSDPEYTLITKENFDMIKKIDPSKYSKLILQYGSDPDNMFYYMCPRYWCLSENRPLTQQQVDNNECKGNVIEKGVKKVPKNTFIYSFNSDYNKDVTTGLNTIQMYPGFLKDNVHSDGYCLPCCMKGAISDKYFERFKPCSNGGIPVRGEKVIKGIQMRILGPDKFPLDNMKYGYLTLSLESFLNIKSTEFQDKDTISVIPNTLCILRRGVDNGVNKLDSFIGCIAVAYSLHTNKELPNPQSMREILANSLSLDKFVQYHNGNLVSIFYKKDLQHKHTLPKSQEKASVLSLNIPKTTKDKIIASYNAYKDFLVKQVPLNYQYLWDYICDLLDCNLIILHKANEDITDKIEVICPSNAYSTTSYIPSKKTLILYVDNSNYEPLLEYTLYDQKNAKKYKKKININIFFKETQSHPHIHKLLENTNALYMHHCKPIKSTEEIVFVSNLPATLVREHLKVHKYKIEYDIVDYHLKIVGFMVSKDKNRSIVPVYPSNIDINYPIRFIEDERNWINYEMSRDFLLELYNKTKSSKHPILCNPVSKIVDDTERIIGFFTMTGQFIQVVPVLQSSIIDDSLIVIRSQHNYNEEDKIFDKSDEEDIKRKTFVKHIKLEHHFYISFRNTLKWILSDYKYYNKKQEIKALIQSQIPYDDKLMQMNDLLKSILSEFVVFTSMKSTKNIENIELCCNKSSKKKCLNTGVFCIYSDAEQKCKLHVPKENLEHNKDNETIYYIKLADELIRYIHYQQYILNLNNANILNDVEYRINDDEIIILESTLLSTYFKQLKPTLISKNIVNRTYDTTQPLTTIEYDLNYYELYNDNPLEEKEQEIDDKRVSVEPVKSCITNTKELTDFFQNTEKPNPKSPFHLTGLKEDIYEYQLTDNCVFALIVALCKTMNVPLFVKKYNNETKQTFINQYKTVIIRYITKYVINSTTNTGLQTAHNVGIMIDKIHRTQGKINFCKKLKKNITNYPLLVYNPDYIWCNLDLWIIATKEKLPIILINKSDFFELTHITEPRIKEKKIMLLYYKESITNFLLVRQDKKTSNNKPFSYTFIHKNGNYLFNESVLQNDITIKTAIEQYIPLHNWFASFIPLS